MQQRLKYFFTPESQYAKNESRYGGGSSVSVMAVRDGTRTLVFAFLLPVLTPAGLSIL